MLFFFWSIKSCFCWFHFYLNALYFLPKIRALSGQCFFIHFLSILSIMQFSPPSLVFWLLWVTPAGVVVTGEYCTIYRYLTTIRTQSSGRLRRCLCHTNNKKMTAARTMYLYINQTLEWSKLLRFLFSFASLCCWHRWFEREKIALTDTQ
jgi:hypothetical protein